ncbi:MAG: enoyl-CoA hydratase/isomerase family protein [Proteobacteria bacterium]|nr:enoyl-CoA hydratase/isomerase family protein [Pseudomonadota bacterium]MBK7114642.1 enoyl-CoA hydratase/isomerase family protein [Pseudomonadota bacterium]
MSQPISVVIEDGIAVITIDSPPVNAISAAIRRGLLAITRDLAINRDVRAVVLVCAGRTFMAGADISEFAGVMAPPELRNVLTEFESLPQPIVVALHGTALGGGVEVALACHYRIADKGAKLGFPEITLGIVPGAVGTQRLPRIVGAEKALAMFLDGRPVGADEARQLGLVDEIAEGDLRAAAIAYAKRLVAEGKGPRRVRDNKVTPLTEAQIAAFRAQAAKQHKGMITPELDIAAVRASWELPFEQGLAVERAISDGSLGTPESKAMRHLFFAERAVTDVPGVTPADKPREIKRCGIIGSGTMGGGIAMSFVNVDISVVLLDVDQASLDRGMATIRKNYDASVKRGRMTPADVDKRMGLIQTSTKYEDFADCDLVIEAVFEDMALKKKIFAELDRVTKAGAILATNTSTLDINQIGSATRRPQDVVGLHFFSPANVTRLLEIVRTDATANDVVATAFAVAKKVKKVGVLSRVAYGFIGNRMMDPYAREAERLVLEGALPADVDAALEDFGMGMGILAVFDMAGVDVGVKARRANPDQVPKDDPTFYRASQILFDQNWLGQKNGKGYYRYEAGSRDRLQHDEALALLAAEGKKLGVARSGPISRQEITERCIFAMINEGAKILEEGVALRPADIDVVYTSGYAFPRRHGGPMFYADAIGLDTVLAGLKKYGKGRRAADFEPSALLKQLAESGSTFAAWAKSRGL